MSSDHGMILQNWEAKHQRRAKSSISPMGNEPGADTTAAVAVPGGSSCTLRCS